MLSDPTEILFGCCPLGRKHHGPACSELNSGRRVVGLVCIRPNLRKRLRPQFAALSVAQRALHLSVVIVVGLQQFLMQGRHKKEPQAEWAWGALSNVASNARLLSWRPVAKERRLIETLSVSFQ